MTEMRAQAERFGSEIMQGNVTSVDLQHRPFTISFAGGSTVTADSLIIATGASARWLEIGSDRKLSGTACPRAPRATATSSAASPSPSLAAATRRWKSHLPHALRDQGLRGPSSRHAARVEDHAGQGDGQSEDRFIWDSRSLK